MRQNAIFSQLPSLAGVPVSSVAPFAERGKKQDALLSQGRAGRVLPLARPWATGVPPLLLRCKERELLPATSYLEWTRHRNYCTTKEAFSESDAPEPASVVLTSKTYWPFGKVESGVETFEVTVSGESSSNSASSTGADRWNN